MSAKTEYTEEWVASERQSEFLSRRETEVLYGGAARSGKTDGLLIYGITRRISYPGSHGLFLRRTFSMLELGGEAPISRSHELLSNIPGVYWNANHRRWNFPNGSTEEFGHMEEDRDWAKYQGTQYADIKFDELCQFTREQYEMVALARTATRRPSGDNFVPPEIRSATNPLGIGLAWVKERFIDIAPPGVPYYDPITKTTRIFIGATIKDNPHIDAGYGERLAGLSEQFRRALLEGRWDLIGGLAFPEWSGNHVCRPFRIPLEWPRWMGIDWGYDKPFVAISFTQDPKSGRYYAYRELYMRGLISLEQAIRVREASGDERILYYVADPTMWIRLKGPGSSHSDEYAHILKRHLIKGSNERIMGKARVHWLLSPMEDGLPRLQFFDTCTNSIRTFPTLVVDPHNSEDVNTRGDDHCYDATRYWAMFVSQPQDRPARIPYTMGVAYPLQETA